MSRARVRIVALFLAIAPLVGCAVLAGKSDYADYRYIRMAENDHDRLVAMHRYVSRHPDGTWSTAVQEERTSLDREVYESNKSTREGLEFYLQVFPDGQYATDARPRLAALQRVQGRRSNEQETALQVNRERRASREEARRQWVTKAVQFWTSTMLGIENWGSPLPQVARRNAAFSRAFGNPPAPRCSGTECIKFYRAGYAIPVPGSTRIEREMEVMLRLRMDGGNLVRTETLLPNKGFSRWYELENRELVVDEDPTERQHAIEWALERVVAAIREAAPGVTVDADVVPEPIDPPTVTAGTQGDTATTADPDETAPPTPVQPAADAGTPAVADAGAAQGGEIDRLLAAAAGDQAADAGAAPPVTAPVGETQEMVLPIALTGYRVRQLRIVVFAAADEDYGSAYDGFFVELVR